ncbi:MAG TPA: AAA family ATPase [Gaiellaceae bacterium]|nr:AAA family ATPase [Gaiellaceae bacterium]
MNRGTLKALVALDEGVDANLVEASLPSASRVQVAGIVSGLDRGWTVLEETAPDLLLIACSTYSERALYLIENSIKQRPERPVVVLFLGSPDGFMQRAFEAGADELLTLPAAPDEVRFALDKVLARRSGGDLGAGSHPMICVLGPKGGTGKSITSTNLAVALALAGSKPVLVDLDLQFGDVGIALGLAPERTIHDLARVGGSIDPGKVEGFLTAHSSGAKALLAPSRPDQAAAVTVEFLREVYGALRLSHDYVIVDTAPGFTPEVIASIDTASHLIVVGMLDALSLKDTKLGLETLELMGCEPERIRLVLNRADSKVGISLGEAETILGRAPDILVPSDEEIPRALTEGLPIVLANERSPAARAYSSLADLYLEEQRPEPSSNGDSGRKRGRRLLSWKAAS